jgi:hypothetical protein
MISATRAADIDAPLRAGEGEAGSSDIMAMVIGGTRGPLSAVHEQAPPSPAPARPDRCGEHRVDEDDRAGEQDESAHRLTVTCNGP